MVLPTDTPAEIVDVWRGAIKKMTEDPDFIEAAPKNIGPFPVVIGEDVRGIIGKAVDLSDAANSNSMMLLLIISLPTASNKKDNFV